MISTESLFTLAAVFAAERRKVVTVDIEGAFLHGVMTREIYKEISGQSLDVLLYNEDIYREMVYITYIYIRAPRSGSIWYHRGSKSVVRYVVFVADEAGV